MEPLISVIIPVYGVEPYLDACVASVLAQSYKNLQVILVDDGSPDRCPAMCDAWARRDPRIQVIHQANGGLSQARNAGLSLATGQYVAFVDSDDWIEPTMYATLLDAMEEENCDIAACAIRCCYPDRQTVLGGDIRAVGDSAATLARLYQNTHYPVSALNKLYRYSLWKEIRFPVGKICEDAFTCCLLVDRAEKIVQIPQPLYCYRIRENSIMTTPFRLQRMDEEEAWRFNLEFVGSHYPDLEPLCRDFYLQKVFQLMQSIPKAQRNTYQAQYRFLRGIARKHLPYLLTASTLPPKERLHLLKLFFR